MRSKGNNIDININGATICYDDFGEGPTPIIFVHGFPFDKSSWQPQMDFFKHTHRVIAYDIRGFGKSTLGEEELSMRLFADDLVKLMDDLQIKKAIVCGLSMGGYVLMNAAYRYAHRFEAIILSDTQCIADSAEIKINRAETIAQIKTEGLNNFAERYVKNIFCEDTLSNKNELVLKIRDIILSTFPSTIIGTLHALAKRWQMCPSLKEISIPALILCGKEDKITPLVQSEIMLKNITNSTMKIIDHAGHMSNLEQPEKFNIHLTSFISSVLQQQLLCKNIKLNAT